MTDDVATDDAPASSDDEHPLADDVKPADETPKGDAEKRSSRRWPLVIAVVIVLGAVAALGSWGVSQRSDAETSRARLERQREAVLVASGFVEALLSYDHQDLDAQQAAVEQFTTEQFRSDYVEAFSSDVREQIIAEQATSTVTVDETWLTVDGDDEVSAVVHARSSIASAGGATAELESYLRVRLVRLGGRWQVDDLTSLGSRDLSAPLPEPGTTDEEPGTGG